MEINYSAVEMHIKQITRNAEVEFDKHFTQEIEYFTLDLTKMYQILTKLIDRPEGTILNEEQYQSALMFWSALNSCFAAFELLRKGYYKDPNVILRHSLEIASFAHDLACKPQKLNDLRKGKSNSPKSITNASKIMPMIGNLYGKLTKFNTHASLLHTVPQGENTNKTILHIGGGYADSEKPKYAASFVDIELLLFIIHGLIEHTFFHELENHEYWELSIHGELRANISTSKISRVSKSLETLEALVFN